MTNILFYRRPHYSIDTSALIDWWKYYPRDIFPGMHSLLENLIADRRLQAPIQVHEEVKGNDRDPLELANCCKNQPGLFCSHSEIIQAKVQEIVAKYQEPKKALGIANADPFVISLAATGGEMWHAVSHESPKHGNGAKNPNIPYVCDKEGIKHITFMGLLRCENWTDTNRNH